MYGAPFVLSARSMVSRKDIMEEYGVAASLGDGLVQDIGCDKKDGAISDSASVFRNRNRFTS